MLKKQITLKKGLHIVKENPIVLLYHFNNICIKDWQLVKNEIKKNDGISTLVIQNNVACEIIKKLQFNDLEFKTIKEEREFSTDREKFLSITNSSLKNLFQGPTFILGCKKSEELVIIHNLLKNPSGFLFIGGLYENQNISHLTLGKVVKLNERAKQSFIQFLENKKLENVVVNRFLLTNCLNFLQVLEGSLQKNKKKEI